MDFGARDESTPSATLVTAAARTASRLDIKGADAAAHPGWRQGT